MPSPNKYERAEKLAQCKSQVQIFLERYLPLHVQSTAIDLINLLCSIHENNGKITAVELYDDFLDKNSK